MNQTLPKAFGIAVEIHRLLYRYSPLSFELRVGELRFGPGCSTAIVGPSGCGKTTLLELIGGLKVPSRGNIIVDALLLDQLPSSARRQWRRDNVGFVFQHLDLFEHLTVSENIRFPLEMSGSAPPAMLLTQEIERLLEETNLAGLETRRVSRLSRGEQQRVALCRALLSNPPLLLADEPTGSLDPLAKERMMSLLIAASRQRGATLIVATHDHSLLPMFDAIVRMEELGGAI